MSFWSSMLYELSHAAPVAAGAILTGFGMIAGVWRLDVRRQRRLTSRVREGERAALALLDSERYRELELAAGGPLSPVESLISAAESRAESDWMSERTAVIQ